MRTGDIRNIFLDYFESQGHRLVDSSSLVPKNDPTLLFTNAGMVQFKEFFLGLEKPPYEAAVSAQRCVRAGGKHNDLDNVGFTARHHTFFEMLGNFSFGGYFKEEAIKYSWQLLTEVLEIPKNKLWVTVLEGDNEAADLWLKKIGLDKTRLVYCGETENFWMMGDTGPCGPCSEIFYDHGPSVKGGPPGSADASGDRFVEIWNLVFMQYERSPTGEKTKIPVPCVDTGMGLERISAVKQGVTNNYDIDLFVRLISGISKIFSSPSSDDNSLKVIADHIRSCSFLIADGVVPSNEGRGYVLRRIVRRALRHGHKLGNKEIFFHGLISILVKEMGTAYGILADKADFISETLKEEEERFLETLDNGMKILLEHIGKSKADHIDGEMAFRLYDTYGFPVDLTADVAREHGVAIDMKGFEDAMELQRRMGRKSHQFSRSQSNFDVLMSQIPDNETKTSFVGYELLSASCGIKVIFVKGETKSLVTEGENAVFVLDSTTFYAESGGQVGDSGRLVGPDGIFEVEDTQIHQGYILHVGKQVSGQIKNTDTIKSEVHAITRLKTRANHSATHLIHAALRSVLGGHIEQKGSYVDSTKLRFDFSHNKALTKEELMLVERMVNSEIRANSEIETQVMNFDKAIERGALAFFEEKYEEEVRVLTMGTFSSELCGGTHAYRTGDLGLVKITSQTSVGSGLRRIEAVAGEAAEAFVEENQRVVENVSELVKGSSEKIEEKVSNLLEVRSKLEKEIDNLKKKLIGNSQGDLSESIQLSGDIKIISKFMPDSTMDILRSSCDSLKDKHKKIVVVLGAVEEGKVRLVAGVTKDLTHVINAVDLINVVAIRVGGKGGGRPDLAQAGGSKPEGLEEALSMVHGWVEEKVSGV